MKKKTPRSSEGRVKKRMKGSLTRVQQLGQLSFMPLQPQSSRFKTPLESQAQPREKSHIPLLSPLHIDADAVANNKDCIRSQDFFCTPDYITPNGQYMSTSLDCNKGCNHLRGRRAGSSLHLEVNIEVDPFSSVSAAHDAGEGVRRLIQKLHHEVAEVFIHIDPAISLVLESVTDQVNTMETNWQSRNPSSDLKDIEDIVSNILSSKFSEKLVLQRTRHLLGDKILLQIEVSMPPDMSIRDAIKVAEEAEREILKAASDAVQVFILLRLGHTIPEYSSFKSLNVNWKDNVVSLSSFPVASLLIIHLAAPGAVLVFCTEDFSRHDFPPDFVFGSGASAYQGRMSITRILYVDLQ
ncbi:hypothetical protein RHMOL_Rhmol06G0051000 [Rhododendron molle]|uniref:Uncharacterized protein n=1 Tax=Rhododendron molle TaxID=49168 RepID=A0ACC0N8X7_RHOML|nr:hypothetical protein RHMOL_Rhmol06G0051000 [Rhododendron molle]